MAIHNILFSYVIMAAICRGNLSEVKNKFVMVGNSAELFCNDTGHGELVFCRFQRQDNAKNTNLQIIFPNATINFTDYVPVGDGCGMQIRNVSIDDITIWSGLSAYEHGSDKCSIQLVMAIKPTFPSMADIGSLVEEDGVFQNNNVDLKCCSEGGIPPPNIGFIYDESEVNGTMTETVENTNLTCGTWTNARFSWQDDGNEVKCFQNHITSDQIELTTQNLTILYGPKLRSEDKSALLYTISANPIPEVTKIAGIQIELTENPNFINTWDIVVTANSSTLGDGDQKLDLEFHNSYGNLKIPVTVSAPTTTTTDTPTTPSTPASEISKPDQDKTNMWVYIGGGISVVIVIIITLAVVISRNRGVLCFRRMAGNYPVQYFAGGVIDSDVGNNSSTTAPVQNSSLNEEVEAC